ncbi:MAG: hypothetical protein KHZ65_18040 [Phocaeicola vulgatus]|nr:hypothetical protein [Phocaeicola vulgatus]
MPYLYPIDEAIGLLNNEIRLVEWRIKYPEQFKSHFNFFYFFVHCTEQGTHFRLFSEYPFQEKFCLQNEEQDVHCS